MRNKLSSPDGNSCELLCFAVVFFLIASPGAEAYCDPSTGSYIVETASGAFFVFLYLAKRYFESIKKIFCFHTKFPRKQQDLQA